MLSLMHDGTDVHSFLKDPNSNASRSFHRLRQPHRQRWGGPWRDEEAPVPSSGTITGRKKRRTHSLRRRLVLMHSARFDPQPE